jgi:hypothetical protein
MKGKNKHLHKNLKPLLKKYLPTIRHCWAIVAMNDMVIALQVLRIDQTRYATTKNGSEVEMGVCIVELVPLSKDKEYILTIKMKVEKE